MLYVGNLCLAGPHRVRVMIHGREAMLDMNPSSLFWRAAVAHTQNILVSAGVPWVAERLHSGSGSESQTERERAWGKSSRRGGSGLDLPVPSQQSGGPSDRSRIMALSRTREVNHGMGLRLRLRLLPEKMLYHREEEE